jgi:hypothetical protein
VVRGRFAAAKISSLAAVFSMDLLILVTLCSTKLSSLRKSLKANPKMHLQVRLCFAFYVYILGQIFKNALKDNQNLMKYSECREREVNRVKTQCDFLL